jgi:hypothetical protein
MDGLSILGILSYISVLALINELKDRTSSEIWPMPRAAVSYYCDVPFYLFLLEFNSELFTLSPI